jgi:hypothetical protein
MPIISSKHRRLLRVCRLSALAIDVVSAGALFFVVLKINGQIAFALAWSSVFLLVSISLEQLAGHISEKQKIFSKVVLHLVKTGLAFFEAVFIFNTFGHQEAEPGGTITAIVSQTVRKDPVFLALLFGSIYGLDVLVALLPYRLNQSIISGTYPLPPGKTFCHVFELGDDGNSASLSIAYSIGGFANDLVAKLFAVSHDQETVFCDFGVIQGNGGYEILMPPGKYRLAIENPACNWFSRQLWVRVAIVE